MKKTSLKIIFKNILFWTLAFALWTFLREYGQPFLTEKTGISFFGLVKIHLVLGLIAGVLFGLFEIFFEKYVYKRLSFGMAVLIGTLSYFLGAMLLLLIAVVLFSRTLENEFEWQSYRGVLFTRQTIAIIVYCFLVGAFINIHREVEKKFGPGNLRKLLTGVFYEPKIEDRIFMFLDLKSSTAIAERLGHIIYSKLIQDCFKDIGIVQNYDAEIYQYVGDEAVLTWKKEAGLKKNNCVHTFLAFHEKIESRSKYYKKKYGLVPRFKAGMHMGTVTAAEVGEIKREIAYHGDTINTASRIQDECNLLGKQFLISAHIKENLSPDNRFRFQFEGNILLKGKSESVAIYSVLFNLLFPVFFPF